MKSCEIDQHQFDRKNGEITYFILNKLVKEQMMKEESAKEKRINKDVSTKKKKANRYTL